MGKKKPKKEGEKEGEKSKDPYGGGFYKKYRRVLEAAMRRRWATLAGIAVIFAVSMYAFGFVPVSFFPNSTRPQFFIDFYFTEGTRIEVVTEHLKDAEEYLHGVDGVTHVTTFVGGGQVRFLLTYTPEGAVACFGQILVDVDDYKRIASIEHAIQRDLEDMYPEAVVNVR